MLLSFTYSLLLRPCKVLPPVLHAACGASSAWTRARRCLDRIANHGTYLIVVLSTTEEEEVMRNDSNVGMLAQSRASALLKAFTKLHPQLFQLDVHHVE